MNTMDIILPADQLEGTSATLSKWLVKIGQQVLEGDPIVELETDKVSMEICAERAGSLSKIIANEGDEIEVDVVLGLLDTSDVNAMAMPEKGLKEPAKTDNQTSTISQNASSSQAGSAHHLVGPAVRRLLSSHDVNIDRICGTGRRGRVTRDDVNAYLAELSTRASDQISPVTVDIEPHSIDLHSRDPLSSSLPVARALTGTKVPHSKIRKAIASHMVESLLKTSPHVTSVFEMDMSNIIAHRKWHKKEFAELGVNLTFTAYFLAAVVKAVQEVPQVNARFHQDALELFSDVNIGVGTALGDKGLVVPVVQQVQAMNLFSIAKSLNMQTEKARNGKLIPSDMKNGTFTISNHGVSGSLFATPIIINQPEVAILGIGKLEKRVTVEEISGVDTMVIKPKCYVSLSIDHRALDAHQTNMFLAKFVDVIEHWG